jgi:putative oxidoreductase
MWTLNLGLLILRIFPSTLMIISQGWPKMMQFSTLQNQFPNPIGLGSTISLVLTIIIEVFCPLLVILGFATRINSGLIFLLMTVAAFVVHANDPWSSKEMAIMYAIPYFVLTLTGSGNYSIDQKKSIIF